MRNRSLMWWFQNSKLPKCGENYRIYEDMGAGRLQGGGMYRGMAQIPSRYLCRHVQNLSFSENEEITITLRGWDYARQ